MNRKGRKIRLLQLIAYVMTFIVVMSMCVFANELDDAKDDLDNTKKNINNAENQIEQNKVQAAQLLEQISTLEGDISRAEGEIAVLREQISVTENQISETLLQLGELEGQINSQNESLSERLRAMYKNGDVGLFSVLLGSSNMSEFITNLNMVQRIFKSDADLIHRLDDQYQKVMTRKAELADLQETLKAQQAELSDRKAALDKDVQNSRTLRAQVEKNTVALEQMIEDLNKKAEELKEEILKMQSSGKYTGGRMCWPSAASSRVTSPFGYRIHPISGSYSFHTGIDIGATWGTEILAANSGKVMQVIINPGHTGYGTYLMIDHGGGIVTLYAHCSSILVSTGQYVARGQTVALIGTTGASTGPHLHFEVRVDGQYQNPLEWVTQGQYFYD